MTERRAIGTVFYDMDKELTTLEDRLAEDRAIQQGMLQQLPTSSMRLPILDVNVNDGPVR